MVRWAQLSNHGSWYGGKVYLTQFDAITDEPEQEKLVALGKLTNNLIPALDKLEEVIKTNQKVMEEHQKNNQEEIKKFVASLEVY